MIEYDRLCKIYNPEMSKQEARIKQLEAKLKEIQEKAKC